jgi:hypothetical protein
MPGKAYKAEMMPTGKQKRTNCNAVLDPLEALKILNFSFYTQTLTWHTTQYL